MNNSKLHHLAVVVADIERSAEVYKKLLDISPVTEIIQDQRQKVHIQFLAGPVLGDLQLELLAPDSDDSPVASALRKGGGLNHLCFEVADLDRAVQHACGEGSRLISEPLRATAIDNRKIAFIFTPDEQVVEFLEAPTHTSED